MIPSFLQKISDASKQSKPPIQLRPKPSLRERVPGRRRIISAFWGQLGLDTLKMTGVNDNRNPTYSRTVQVQTLWKKMDLFYYHLYTKFKSCFSNQECFFPPLGVLFCIYAGCWICLFYCFYTSSVIQADIGNILNRTDALG